MTQDTQTGTLEELNVKPGDVVEMVTNEDADFIGEIFDIREDGRAGSRGVGSFNPKYDGDFKRTWRLISRATPLTWGDMTDAEKGASSVMDCIEYIDEMFDSELAERARSELGIKPEPLVETVTLYGAYSSGSDSWNFWDSIAKKTHRITFTTTNGEPDLDSIKMELIK